MKCNPFRWLWGLIPIAMLSWIAVVFEHPHIETDLQNRLRDALSRQGAGWATPTFSGRDGVIVGEAPEESEQKRAIAIARGVWGVRRIDNQTALIEEQQNYSWSAALRDSRVRLSGFVPNENTRKAIVGAAKATFPGRDVDDRMKLARGAPATDVWLGGVSFGLKQLARLKSGSRVDLDGTGLVVEGETEDLSTYHGIKAALANNMPHGIKLKHEKVLPPAVKPYFWLAKLASNQVQLEGHVPSEREREDVLGAAKKALPKAVIIDRMQPGSGEPTDFLRAVTAVLRQLAHLEEASVELKDNHMIVAGIAASEETAEAVRRTIKAEIPASIGTADQIGFREPTIKTISPFTTSAAVDASTVVLSGSVPSDALRAAALEAAKERLPGRRIDDQLELAAGAPEGWRECFEAGLLGLSRFGNGHVQIADRVLEIAADAVDGDVVEAVRGEVRKAADRACEVAFKVTVTAPPEPDLTWRAVYSAGALLLEGEVPDAATKDGLTQAAASLFPGARVVDHMNISPAQFTKWPEVADAGLKMLAQLRSGEVRLAGRDLTVRGEVSDPAIAAALRGQLDRDLAAGYTGHDLIEVRSDAMISAEQEASRQAEADALHKPEEAHKGPTNGAPADAETESSVEEEQFRAQADAQAEEHRLRAEADRNTDDRQRIGSERKSEREKLDAADVRRSQEDSRRSQMAALEEQQKAEVSRCQKLLSTAAKSGIIKFRRASTDLDRASFATLDELAQIANACPDLRIEIEGHTDAEGTPQRNKRLSERRARSVVDYLKKAGVPADRLTAAGYGETRPVAPNDTIENRAKNRRIEFAVTAN
jgi:OOP family OmpA-OmpF porin